MPQPAISDGPFSRLVRAAPGRVRGLGAVGLALAALSLALPDAQTAWGLLAAGMTLTLTALALDRLARGEDARADSARQVIADFVEGDAVPCVISDLDGAVRRMNPAARDRFGEVEPGQSGLSALLRREMREPGPVVLRLQTRLDREPAAREDVPARDGHLRISVHAIPGNWLFWRIEPMTDRAEGPPQTATGALPMVTVGRGNAILFMNDPARRMFGGRARTLDAIFAGMPPRPGEVNAVATADGPRDILLAEIDRVSGRRELFFLPPGGSAARPGAPDMPDTPADGFAALPVPLLRLAADGTVLKANVGARDLLADERVEGRNVTEVMEGLGRPIADWLAEAAAGRGLAKSEFLRLRRDDREAFVQVTLSGMGDREDGALYAVLNDATELKTLEAKFVQSQKMQAIGQLAGGVAHDFNNLLTAISGHCDLLLLRHDAADQDYADLVQINQNANRAAALVGQLLAFSRKQTLRPEVLDLRDTLSDLTHLLNRLVGEKVELVLGHDPRLETVRADKRQLEQVLMNLVVNARDAMPEGGQIRIETQNRSLTRPLRRDRAEVPAGDYVCVTVSDEGTGIPADKLPKVFEPFFTTKRTGEGTGLGLSTAYGIVKQTGGFIFADSTPGEGTVFTLLFPAHRRREPAFEAPAAPPPGRKGAARPDGVVLLVEDEAPVRAFASRALRMRGYTVLEADSAEGALATLEDPDLRVDVFVTDVVMPGMDGPSWVREALRHRPETRVVFVSGYAEDVFDESRQQIPNSVFLPKPFSLSDLTEVVHGQLA